jgi:hypothetical protein
MSSKKSVLRQVFIENKDSSRPQHLAFNEACHKVLWMVCTSAAVSSFVASIYQGGDLVFVWQLMLIPPLFRFHEIWATPDCDLAFKVRSFRGWYWSPYSKMLPKHRSIFSHSLLFGSPVRFCIAYWLPVLTFVLLWNHSVVYGVSQGDIDLTTGLSMITFPMFAANFIAYWYGSCILSDTAHMFLDKMNPVEWLIGESR